MFCILLKLNSILKIPYIEFFAFTLYEKFKFFTNN